MRRILLLSSLATVVLTGALGDVGASALQGEKDDATVSGTSSAAVPPRVARGLIVKATTTSKARRASIARSVRTELPEQVAVASTQAAPAGLSVVRFETAVPVEQLEAAVAQVESRPDVDWVVPDTLRTRTSVPPVAFDDPHLLSQGNLWDTRDVIDGLPTPTVGGFASKAPALWRSTQGRSSVVVAVVDTGITAHPELAGQTVAGYDFVDDECTLATDGQCYADQTYVNAGDGDGWDLNPSDPGDWLDEALVPACYGPVEDPSEYVSDSSWHGTHVAGIVAAKAGNGIGVAGVAPGVKVQPVRVLGHCGGWDLDIVFGTLWAAGEDLRAHGVPANRTPAGVINLSLGAAYDSAQDAAEACQLYGEVAGLVRGLGATLVASAGNDSAGAIAPLAHSVPASCDGYLSVTSTSDTGHRAWYSTAGEGADIAAPGGDMHVPASDPERGILSTINLGATVPGDAGYARYQGTSMAAPAVAAGAALLHSLGITRPAAVEEALKRAVQPFSTVEYGSRTITGGSSSLETDVLDCTATGRTACGAGILDLSRVTAPLGSPRISGSRAPGSVLRAVSRGLTNDGGTSALTWWRGAKQVGTGATHRVSGPDLGQRLTVRDTVTTGGFAGASLSSSVAVPSTKARARMTVSLAARIKRTKRAPIVVRVSAPLVRPTGTVRVHDGSRRIATRTLGAKDAGTLRFTLPKLRKGKHQIRVVYSGDALVGPTSATTAVRSR